jgi:hypothetical protein
MNKIKLSELWYATKLKIRITIEPNIIGSKEQNIVIKINLKLALP